VAASGAGWSWPMQYFKIILWLNDDGELKATAFKLTQETLVDHIQFDEGMRLDEEEALDIDKNTDFDEYQCSIKSLSRLTKINFEQLEQFDTFASDDENEEEVLIEDAEALML
jgi:endonuclease G, mitochondrial